MHRININNELYPFRHVIFAIIPCKSLYLRLSDPLLGESPPRPFLFFHFGPAKAFRSSSQSFFCRLASARYLPPFVYMPPAISFKVFLPVVNTALYVYFGRLICLYVVVLVAGALSFSSSAAIFFTFFLLISMSGIRLSSTERCVFGLF